MAKMFDKVSQDFLSAIKGVLEAKKVNKHGHDVPGEEDADIDNDGDTDKSDKYLHNRRKAIGKAMMKKESAEQIDEISTKLALDYMDKASDARGHKNMSTAKQDKRYKSLALAHEKIRARRAKVATTEAVGDITVKSKSSADAYAQHTGQVKKKNSVPKDPKTGKTLYQKVTSEEAEQVDEYLVIPRRDNLVSLKKHSFDTGLEDEMKKTRQTKKSVADAKKKYGVKEDVEQIDELSKKTLGSYVSKAAKSAAGLMAGAAASGAVGTPSTHGKQMGRDALRRLKGIDTAAKKMAKEDAQLTPEEIAMIEAKLAGVADGSMEGDKHMCATKVFHKEWNEGTPIKTMHADPDENGLIEWYDVMFDHGIERVMTEDMEILQAESHMHSKKKMKEEVEELDELSKDTMLKYLSANKKSDAAAQEKGDYSKSVKRMRGTDVAVRKYTAKPGSKYVRVPATEEVELDEARGRPKKAAAKDYTINPRTKEKLMHDNPEHMKKIEKLVKNKVIEMPKTEAGQHIINQLRKASTSMTGGATVHFTHGESKHVSAAHAGKALDKYASMKPTEKEDFQKKIGHSHEQMMKHI